MVNSQFRDQIKNLKPRNNLYEIINTNYYVIVTVKHILPSCLLIFDSKVFKERGKRFWQKHAISNRLNNIIYTTDYYLLVIIANWYQIY